MGNYIRGKAKEGYCRKATYIPTYLTEEKSVFLISKNYLKCAFSKSEVKVGHNLYLDLDQI